MYFVYMLRSLENPKKTYVGLTEDVDARFEKHNEGGSPHTAKYRPWELMTYVAFKSRERAAEFETYLKVGSGHAFAKRHLW